MKLGRVGRRARTVAATSLLLLPGSVSAQQYAGHRTTGELAYKVPGGGEVGGRPSGPRAASGASDERSLLLGNVLLVVASSVGLERKE